MSLSILSSIGLIILSISSTIVNGGYADCHRAYAYKDYYRATCFKHDNFNECGFTNKFYTSDFASNAQELTLYIQGDDDACCDIGDLIEVGKISFSYSHQSYHYNLEYSINDYSYGFQSFDVFIGAKDHKYPQDSNGDYTIDFKYYSINQNMNELVHSASFNEPFTCDSSLYLIASAVVCHTDEPVDECDSYDPYYIPECSKDPCPCYENKLCIDTECKENGCNQCEEGAFQKGRNYPCLNCKEFFGEGCKFCNDEFGCAQCESGYYQVKREDAKCGLSYCVKIPNWHTPNPTKWKATDPPTSWTDKPTSWTSDPTSWTPDPTSWTPAPSEWKATDPPTSWTDKPTEWTAPPTPWTDKPTSWTAPPTPWTNRPTEWTAPPTLWTDKPTPWTAAPTPWTKEPSTWTAAPTPWTDKPTSWTVAPTPWTAHPTSWTPSPTDACNKYDPFYIPPCSYDPCPCYENKYCEMGQCKVNGCNKCKQGTFQKGREYPCVDCQEMFGEGCMFCNDNHGCAQCKPGYTQIPKEDTKCHLSYCVKDPTPSPTEKPTASPTSWTAAPTPWSEPPTSWTTPPTRWTEAPTPWSREPTSWTAPPTPWTDKPTSWTSEPTSWTAPPTPWTNPPTPWTAPPTPWTDKPTSWTAAPTPWTAPPTPWTPEPTTKTDPPTSWTAAPTPWTREPTSWTAAPTPWSNPPTSWSAEPSSWTVAPTPWTSSPTSWTGKPTSWSAAPTPWTHEPTKEPTPSGCPIIPPCTKDPCPCDENPKCEYDECKVNGCNKCKEGFFQKGREYPCVDCKKTFGEGCNLCNDEYGCAQCDFGYHRVVKEESYCGLSYCIKCDHMDRYEDCAQQT